jgi:hypothetical protein
LTWTDNFAKEVGFTVQRVSDANFTTGLRTFAVGSNVLTYQDSTVADNTVYWYRVFATGGIVGDTQTPGFPTLFADSVSNTCPAGRTVNGPSDPTAAATRLPDRR